VLIMQDSADISEQRKPVGRIYREADMKKTSWMFVLLLAAFSASCSSADIDPIEPTITPTLQSVEPTPTTEPPYAAPAHIIQVRVVDGLGEFYDVRTGETFYPRGVNYIKIVDTGEGYLENRVFDVGGYDHDRFAADMEALASRGYNTVRLFIDTCSSDYGCITDPQTGRLNSTYLENLADAMSAAKEAGIFLLLTSNDLPTKGVYWSMSNRQADSDSHFAGYRNAHILTQAGRESAVTYWTDLMTGLLEQRAQFDAVLGWSLFNEQWLFGDQPPLNMNEGILETGNGLSYDLSDPDQKRAMVAENLLLYITEVGAVIREYDPTALVTVGFFAPQFPNETVIGGTWYVDTAALIERGAPLDFYDFHAYPGDDLTMAQLAENFGMVGHEEIPTVLGEYGAFEHRYATIMAAARAVTQWAAEACEQGWDGWLYWSYFDLPSALGDHTWGLVEDDNYLLDLFAPVNQPDICTPVEVPTANIAFGKPVSASSTLPEGPGTYAVDESLDTSWQSGRDAPGWVKIDLEAAYQIEEIRLLVGQWPEGATIHRIYFRQAGTTDTRGNWQLFHEFSQPTTDLDWLVFSPEDPIENIQFIMVETISSPSWVSWREIEVYGTTQD
jgi:hypothetical protein